MNDNPFSISFGKRPTETIERYYQKNEILDGFRAESMNQQIFVITGIRGSGKTVLMTQVAAELKNDDDWIVISLNPETDLLKGLAAKLSGNRICAEWITGAKINLSFLGLGVEVQGAPPITDYETAIERMLESIKKHRKRVLVTVDEVTNSQQMRIFAAAFQMMIRDDLPAFLLMTGLYENIYDLQNEKSLTFLYRAPKIKLEPLNRTAIQSRYRSIFKISEEEAKEMALMTGGYPFAFQALGYLTWRNDNHYKGIESDYRQILEEYVYDKIWTELSEKDKTVLTAVAETADGNSSEIRKHLDMAENQYAPYRQRLIRKGVVDGSERGFLKLTLPFFKEYILDKR